MKVCEELDLHLDSTYGLTYTYVGRVSVQGVESLWGDCRFMYTHYVLRATIFTTSQIFEKIKQQDSSLF